MNYSTFATNADKRLVAIMSLVVISAEGFSVLKDRVIVMTG